MIRLVLVDDHPVVRAGLRALPDAEDDLEVVAAVDGLDAASAVVAAERPDVVLVDLNLGEGRPGGVEITAALRGLSPAPEVMVLTTYDTEADVLRALDAGARGYLLKDAPPEELFAGIRATARGQLVLAPSVAALLVRRASPGANAITGREVLFVSEATVQCHLSHICSPLGVDTRAGAVAAAIERRILRA